MCGTVALQQPKPRPRPEKGSLLSAMARVPLAGTNWIPGANQ